MKISIKINNLDYLCAKYGQKIPETIAEQASRESENNNQNKEKILKEGENLIRKSLGVLQEEGPFAFVMFLQSKEERIKSTIIDKCELLYDSIELIKTHKDSNLQDKLYNASGNIDKMFLVKRIIERCLIYALYRIRALIIEEKGE